MPIRAAALLLVTLVVLVPRPAQAGTGPGGFADVRGNEYYGAAVAWMAARGITTGVGALANVRIASRCAVA